MSKDKIISRRERDRDRERVGVTNTFKVLSFVLNDVAETTKTNRRYFSKYRLFLTTLKKTEDLH